MFDFDRPTWEYCCLIDALRHDYALCVCVLRQTVDYTYFVEYLIWTSAEAGRWHFDDIYFSHHNLKYILISNVYSVLFVEWTFVMNIKCEYYTFWMTQTPVAPRSFHIWTTAYWWPLIVSIHRTFIHSIILCARILFVCCCFCSVLFSFCRIWLTGPDCLGTGKCRLNRAINFIYLHNRFSSP